MSETGEVPVYLFKSETKPTAKSNPLQPGDDAVPIGKIHPDNFELGCEYEVDGTCYQLKAKAFDEDTGRPMCVWVSKSTNSVQHEWLVKQ